MSEFTFSEAFVVQGAWQLPGIEQWLPGALRYSTDEGIHLDIFGAPIITDEHPPGGARYDIVLGMTTSGTPVTLRGCFQQNLNFGMAGIPRSSFRALWAFFGAHFPSDDSIRFNTLSGSYAYLDEWVGATGVSIDHPELSSTRIDYRKPDSHELEVGSNLRIRFGFASHFTPRRFSAAIEQTTWVTAERPAPAHLDDLLLQLGQVQNLVSLAAGKFAKPIGVEGTPEQSADWRRDRSTQVIFVPRPTEETNARRTDLLFTMADLAELQSALAGWFEAADLVKPTFDLYFSTVSIPFMYAEHRFLSLAQAAESYHRRKFVGGELTAQQHQLRLSDVLSSAPVEHRDWLTQKLAYSNEPSLRTRLKELLRPAPVIRKALGGGSFANRVVNTRNYLTHYDQRSRKNAAEGVRLHWLSEKLRIVVEMCLLSELGLSSSAIATIILRQAGNQHALSQQS